MIVEIHVPEVGESITEGILAAWLKEDGDLVQAGEEIVELETDKVTMAIPSDAAGKLEIVVPEGETVKVGQVVARVDTAAAADGTAGEADAGKPPAATAPAATAPAATAPLPGSDGDPEPPISAPAGRPQAAKKIADGVLDLSPAVRHLVMQHDLDPAAVQGTGKDGRILKGDVLRHLEPEAEAPAAASTPAPDSRPARETRAPMSLIRRRIAERLVQAQQTAAILTTFNEVDMSRVIAARSRYKEKFQARHDVRLGFMSFFVKAVVDALETVPQLNARIEGDEIVQQHYYDIGVAVGTERGLLTPVIRDADRRSFAQIEQQITDLAVRARKRKITLDELTGGCFTISNGGVYNSLLSTPILNPPQSGLLGLHRIQDRPVVVDGQIVIRPMMYLAVSYDHRLVDGSQAVTFLERIVKCIEDPERLLLAV